MTRVLQILRVGSTVVLLSLPLLACKSITRVENHGYLETKPLQEQIAVGQTSKEEVRRLLGSPSTISAFPPETWYYIARQRETVAFFEPELVEQNIARIEFDAAGTVIEFETFDKTATRDVNYVKRETTTEGRSLGLLEQLLGNLGRFNTPRDATQARD